MPKKYSPVQVGDQIPNTTVSLKESDVELREFFKTRKGLFIGVNGAYEPSSTKLLMAISSILSKIRDKVSLIGVISVNDPYVLKAWGRRMKLVDHLTFISDVNAAFTQKLGLSLQLNHLGFGKGPRTRFFMMVVDIGGTILYLDNDSQPDEMTSKLLNFMDRNMQSIGSCEPVFYENDLRPADNYENWQPLKAMGKPYEPICFIPQLPALSSSAIDTQTFHIKPSTFSCHRKVTVSNHGHYLNIEGLQGSLEYNRNMYSLKSVNYRTDIQNESIRCDAECQLVFVDATKASASQVNTLIISIPLIDGGSDLLLSTMPQPDDGYPIKAGYSLSVDMKDDILTEDGVSYHLYNNMNLLQYQRSNELWMMGIIGHGISTKQIKQLKSMMMISTRGGYRREKLSTPVYEATLTCD